MCGKKRTYRPAILEVWQGKVLRANFPDVWQMKELAFSTDLSNEVKIPHFVGDDGKWAADDGYGQTR